MIANKINYNYGKLTDGVISYAPSWLNTEDGIIMNPTREDYLQNGWKEIIDDPPACEIGYHVENDGYEEGETEIAVKYKIVQDAKTYRKFNKYNICVAFRHLEKFDEFMEFVSSDSERQFMWDAADSLEEDAEGFSEYLTLVKSTLNLTDEQVEYVLDYAAE